MPTEYLKIAREVLKLESQSLEEAAGRLSEDNLEKSAEIFQMLRQLGGKLFFCGVGKSGIVGQKLAATFTSLGLPSFFLHPVEALHGDLGQVNKSDAIVFISRSGTTEEIMKLLPYLPMNKELRLSLLGNPQSPLAKACGIVFDCSFKKEACLNNQAPTTSTTLAMAMGDALAVVYEKVVGLTEGSFASNHPGGILGKTMSMKVKDLMWSLDNCPTLGTEAVLKDVILAMTQKPVGGLAIIDQHQNLLGIMVEGDIRRTFTKKNQGLETKVSEIMNKKPVSVGPEDLAYLALEKMEKRKTQISILPVVDQENRFLGFIRLHDLLKEGFFLNS